MANYTISLIIEATNKAAGPIKDFGAKLDNLMQIGSMAAGALGELYSAGQKLFEFGKLGATVDQTSASFARLGMDLGAMRSAVGGTVDDMTLMSSTLTLAAGASDELQGAFATSAADLLKIAKAASALNPTLGDTTFMYESLALGIKRGSPMILDNLGLTISVGKANEKYAQSLGKSVAALTEEEKKIALLNATIEAGNRLIEQNGGNVASATDGFNRLSAATDNLKNSFSQSLAVTGGFFDKLATGVDGLNKWQQALNFAQDQGLGPFAAQVEVAREVLGASNTVFDKARSGTLGMAEANAKAWETISDSQKSMDMYNQAMQQGADTTNYAAGAIQRMRDDTISSNDAWNMYTSALEQGKQSFDDASQKSYELAAAQQAAADSAANAKMSFMDAASAISEMSKAQFAQAQLEALKASLDSGAISATQYAAAQEAVLLQFGILTPAEIQAQAAMNALNDSFVNGNLTAQQYALAIQTNKAHFDAATASQNAYASAASAAAGGSASAANAMMSIGGAASSATTEVTTLSNTIQNIPDKTVRINVEVAESARAAAMTGATGSAAGSGAGQSSTAWTGMQTGFSGIFTRPTVAVFGEGGPERVTAQPLNNVTNNNFNLSVNTPAAASSVAQDFKMMRAFVGR